ncbi:sensor histidine kinase [Ruminococcaceae bacterium OttesenSCG-928-D13]|nr:sensor histidine kinase [Ruminococcaceae bacterium OttesenSCG-928-D13]
MTPLKKAWKALRGAFSSEDFRKEYLVPGLGIAAALLFFGVALWHIALSGGAGARAGLVLLCVFGTVLIALSIRSLYRLFFVKLGRLAAEIEKKAADLPEEEGDTGHLLEDKVLALVNRHEDAIAREYTYQLLQKQAQFDAMQQQINPHFLYNTLDSIRGKSLDEKAPVTADMLETLAALFRYSISSSNDLVTLEEELANVTSYVKIQNFRFQDRFVVICDVEKIPDGQGESLLLYKVPKLTFQPLIENAISHGFGDSVDGGVISIRVYRTQSRVVASVQDNGSGMSDKTLERLNQAFLASEYETGEPAADQKGVGIALRNVNARLKFCFGESYGLQAFSTPGIGTEIVVNLPVMEGPHE